MKSTPPISGAKYWGTVLLVAASYFLTAKLGMLLATVQGNVTPLWPPAGIALAALLLGGWRLFPAVALGALAATASTGAPWQLTLATILGNSAAALAGLWLLNWQNLDRSLERTRDVIGLVLWGGLATTLISATAGAAGLIWAGMTPWPGWPLPWLTWWLGDSMGVITVTPFILCWLARPISSLNHIKPLEVLCWAAAASLAAMSLFGGWTPSHLTHMLCFVAFPMLLWAALRFGRRITATCALVVCYGTVAATASGIGPFAEHPLYGGLVLLWFYLGSLVVTSLALASARGRARRAAEILSHNRDELAQAVEHRTAQLVASHQELWQSHKRTQAILDSISDGFFTVDQKGVFTYFNAAAERLLKRRSQEVLGLTFAEAFPEVVGSVLEQECQRALRENKPLAFESFFEHEPYRDWFNVRVYPSENGISVFFQITTAQKEAALALASSEERLRTLVEESPLGVAVIGNQGEYLYINPQFTSIFGYEREETPRGREWFQRAFPDPNYRRQAVNTWRQDIISSRVGQVRPRTFQVTCKSGESKTIEFRPVTLSTGEQLVIYEDVSERNNALKALRASEEKFSKVFQHSPLWVVLSSLEKGRMLEVNDTFLRSTGYTREEVTGRTTLELGISPTIEGRQQVVDDLLREGSVSGREVRMRTKPGQLLTMLYYGTLIEVGGQRLVLSLLQDVTERKRAEEALAENEEKYRTLFQSANDGIFLVKGTTLLDCNERALEMYGCRREDIIGATPTDFSPPRQPDGRDSREKAQEKLETTVAGEPQNFYWRHQTSAGEPFDTEVSLTRLWIKGEDHVFGVVRDITERKRAEEALRASEEKFQKLYMASPVWMNLTTLREGRYLEVNEAFCQVTGYSRQEALNKTSTELGLWESPSDRETIRRLMQRDGSLRNHPVNFKMKDGQVRQFLWSSEMVELGPEPLMISVHLDVTDLRRAQRALGDSEARFRSVVENSLAGIYVIQKGKWVYVNPRLVSMLGYVKSEDLKGRAPWDFVHPDDRDRVIDRAWMRQDHGMAQRHYSFRAARADGKLIWLEALDAHAMYQGRPAIMGNVVDITQRKATEEALTQSEEQYRLLVENAQDAIYILQDGLFVFANPETERLTGYTAEELRSIDFKRLINPDHLDKVSQRYAHRLAGEPTPTDYPIRILARDGGDRWIQTKGILITWKGQPALLYISRDITQQRAMEGQLRQSQKLEAVGTLAGGIAHDFNNILAAIMGYAELSLDITPPGEELAQNMEQILKASERGRGLVQQILSFSRGAERDLEPLELAALITEALKLLRPATPSNIKIETSLEPCGPVRGDPVQLHQLLMNLVTNAAQAMEETGGVISLSLERTEVTREMAAQTPGLMPGPHLRLTVSDTGPGIPQELRERIFEPFFTTKEAGKGSGLGLAAVHGIVQAHLGAISLLDQPGPGTAFQVLLPEEQGAVLEPGKPVFPPSPTGSERIMFVDDEASLVEVGSNILRRLGYRVSAFTSSRAALATFQADPQAFDLIITDQTMPGLTGAALTQKVKALRPEIPVVITSGFSHQLSAERAGQLGVTAFVMKPIISKEIARVVRLALDSASQPMSKMT
ncbi:MAG: PAS domain S-box protein [Proteobacteria bacterium]|nr:PAS domain S-box protein [Pseudomonadota bacterium]MBU1450908.1 PAS domain S-box protein [Pseudomonadota bacterium]MBU2468727.1 PAS domain S-box protein [Pseudomonadota bacterium]